MPNIALVTEIDRSVNQQHKPSSAQHYRCQRGVRVQWCSSWNEGRGDMMGKGWGVEENL